MRLENNTYNRQRNLFVAEMKVLKLNSIDDTKHIVPTSSGHKSEWSAIAIPSESSMMKSSQPAQESNIPVLNVNGSSLFEDYPRRKRSTRRRMCSVKAINNFVTDILKEPIKLEILLPFPASAQQSPRASQKRKHTKVSACSTVSRKALPRVSRIRGHARRRGNNNGTQQDGKLDCSLLNKYLWILQQSAPSDKKDSFAYIDCLWFTMYHEQYCRDKVLQWIRRERIFSKKYVFLPICRWNHWSLLILCHMGEDLQSKTTTPCMLLLDSLHDADPKRLEPDIRRFLLDIFKAEERRETKRLIYKIPLLIPKVPQQKDDKECGYFVLYYINQFLMRSPESFSICDGYPYFMKEDWFTADLFKSFCKNLRSSYQETCSADASSDTETDNVVIIE